MPHELQGRPPTVCSQRQPTPDCAASQHRGAISAEWVLAHPHSRCSLAGGWDTQKGVLGSNPRNFRNCLESVARGEFPACLVSLSRSRWSDPLSLQQHGQLPAVAGARRLVGLHRASVGWKWTRTFP